MPALLASACGVLGSLLLLAATLFPWFCVPASGGAAGASTIVGVEPGVAIVFKVLCLLAVAGVWWRRRPVPVARLLTLLLVALLLFPYFTMVWSPAVAARASWLQAQHESMSWLGGDIYGAQEIKDVDFKNHVAVADGELPVAAFPLPSWAPETIQWSRLPEVIEWLGYSNAFCAFASRGWFLALGGAVLALVPVCRGKSGLRFPAIEAVGQTGLIAGATAGVVVLLPLFAAGSCLASAREAARGGEPAVALRWLDRAARLAPAIRQDGDFLTQQGVLEQRLAASTPGAALRRAWLLDRQGFTAQARTEFAALLASIPRGSALHREVVGAMLRSAIHLLNSGQSEAAVGALDRVVEEDPCNVKALYALQLACLRTSRLDRLPALVAQMEGVYRYFHTKTKAPVIAAAFENGALAQYLLGHHDEALALRRVSIGRPR